MGLIAFHSSLHVFKMLPGSHLVAFSSPVCLPHLSVTPSNTVPVRWEVTIECLAALASAWTQHPSVQGSATPSSSSLLKDTRLPCTILAILPDSCLHHISKGICKACPNFCFCFSFFKPDRSSSVYSLYIYCKFLLCGYHNAYLKHLTGIIAYFKVITV